MELKGVCAMAVWGEIQSITIELRFSNDRMLINNINFD